MEGVFLQPFQKGGCDAGIPKKGAGGGRLCADPPGGVLPAGEGRAARPRGEGPVPGPAGEGAHHRRLHQQAAPAAGQRCGGV